jgi:hypothetical protein
LCLSVTSAFYANVTAFLFLGIDKSLTVLLFSDILWAPNTQNTLKHSPQQFDEPNKKKKKKKKLPCGN